MYKRQVYASAINGFATADADVTTDNMDELFQTIIDHVPPPPVDVDKPFQMQVSQLDYSSYLGVIGIGRIKQGTILANGQVSVIDIEGNTKNGRIAKLFGFKGMERVELEQAQAGDIVAISGIDELFISDTICARDQVEALPALSIDEPTVTMTFQVNTSPYAGQEGKYLTSRQIRDRLHKELLHNVALRVEDTEDPEKFKVSGRGELHLSVLIENMRREGFELAVSRPEVIYKEVNGEIHEPYENLTVDVPEEFQGSIMQALQERGGDLANMAPDGKGRVRLDFSIPARGLIGFQTDFMTMTSGAGLIYHVFDQYAEKKNKSFGQRKNGVLISNGTGKALGFAIFNLQERGKMMIEPSQMVYEG